MISRRTRPVLVAALAFGAATGGPRPLLATEAALCGGVDVRAASAALDNGGVDRAVDNKRDARAHAETTLQRRLTAELAAAGLPVACEPCPGPDDKTPAGCAIFTVAATTDERRVTLELRDSRTGLPTTWAIASRLDAPDRDPDGLIAIRAVEALRASTMHFGTSPGSTNPTPRARPSTAGNDIVNGNAPEGDLSTSARPPRAAFNVAMGMQASWSGLGRAASPVLRVSWAPSPMWTWGALLTAGSFTPLLTSNNEGDTHVAENAIDLQGVRLFGREQRRLRLGVFGEVGAAICTVQGDPASGYVGHDRRFAFAVTALGLAATWSVTRFAALWFDARASQRWTNVNVTINDRAIGHLGGLSAEARLMLAVSF